VTAAARLQNTGSDLATFTPDGKTSYESKNKSVPLMPICNLIAAEATEKLSSPVTLDCLTPLQAYDAGGRARAAAQVVQLMAQAKEAGVDAEKALGRVNCVESNR